MSSYDDYLSRYGRESIHDGAAEPALAIARLSTGIQSLDNDLAGGIPVERPSLIWGLRGSFKTALALKLAAVAQASGKSVGLVETDGKWTPKLGRALGLVPRKLVVTKPETAKQAVEAIRVVSAKCDVTIFDSLANLYHENASVDHRTQEIAEERMVGACVRAAFGKTVIFLARSKLVSSGGHPGFEIAPGGIDALAACSVEIKLVVTSDSEMADGSSWSTVQYEVRRNRTYTAPKHGYFRIGRGDFFYGKLEEAP